MSAFLSYTDKHKTHMDIIEKFLPTLSWRLIYEADGTLTDCQLRDEHRKDDLFFLYQTGKELSHINLWIEKIEFSLGVYMRPQQPILQGPSNRTQMIRYSSQDDDGKMPLNPLVFEIITHFLPIVWKIL